MKKIIDPKILEGLKICYKVAYMLKDHFPNELMKIKDDTILAHQSKNRKCHGKNMSGEAWYTNSKPTRIIIKQKCLSERKLLRTKIRVNRDRTLLYGNFALIELMCHELAHHRSAGHAKTWKLKYKRFLDFMVNKIISGDYYSLS